MLYSGFKRARKNMSTLAPLPPLPPLTDFHPTCKVCDRGELFPKKIFRMSVPVVAIGFILLIPSILGILASVLLFLGVISYSGNELSNRVHMAANTQDDADTQFRRTCINTHTATPITVLEQEQYCECSLSEYRTSNSLKYATAVCSQRLAYNTLGAVDERTQALYANLIGNDAPSSTAEREPPPLGNVPALFHVIGGTFAIALGVASFVGGLLGWLLVMKKRVLQCSVCGATVSAS